MEAIIAIFIAGMLAALTIALRVLFSALFAFPLYWAWNESMVVLFGLPSLDWGSAFCLLVVAAILLPSSSSSQSSKK